MHFVNRLLINSENACICFHHFNYLFTISMIAVNILLWRTVQRSGLRRVDDVTFRQSPQLRRLWVLCHLSSTNIITTSLKLPQYALCCWHFSIGFNCNWKRNLTSVRLPDTDCQIWSAASWSSISDRVDAADMSPQIGCRSWYIAASMHVMWRFQKNCIHNLIQCIACSFIVVFRSLRSNRLSVFQWTVLDNLKIREL